WGVTGRIDAPPFGRLFHKTSPSGGARHPGEVYLLAMRVGGLAQGLYHYNCLHHRLERLRSLQAVEKAVAYTAGQEFVGDASALFIMTAIFPRVQWKYRFARSYRVVLLETGHLCQTFCLVATWLGLAPFCTAAFEDTMIEEDLSVDGIRESALYVAGGQASYQSLSVLVDLQFRIRVGPVAEKFLQLGPRIAPSPKFLVEHSEAVVCVDGPAKRRFIETLYASVVHEFVRTG